MVFIGDKRKTYDESIEDLLRRYDISQYRILDVFTWVQSFSDTSLGLGGMAGQAISQALCVGFYFDRKLGIKTVALYVAGKFRWAMNSDEYDSETLLGWRRNRMLPIEKPPWGKK